MQELAPCHNDRVFGTKVGGVGWSWHMECNTNTVHFECIIFKQLEPTRDWLTDRCTEAHTHRVIHNIIYALQTQGTEEAQPAKPNQNTHSSHAGHSHAQAKCVWLCLKHHHFGISSALLLVVVVKVQSWSRE